MSRPSPGNTGADFQLKFPLTHLGFARSYCKANKQNNKKQVLYTQQSNPSADHIHKTIYPLFFPVLFPFVLTVSLCALLVAISHSRSYYFWRYLSGYNKKDFLNEAMQLYILAQQAGYAIDNVDIAVHSCESTNVCVCVRVWHV